MAKAVFLDRDGTIIHDRNFLGDPSGVELMSGAAEALRRLRAAGYLLVVTTNQSGVARGYFTADDVLRVHQRMAALLEAEGVALTAHKYCPHGPEDDCPCRKPRPGMLLEAARDLDIELSQSVSIGDKPRDAEAGLAAGCALNILLGKQRHDAPYQAAADIAAAAELVLGDA